MGTVQFLPLKRIQVSTKAVPKMSLTEEETAKATEAFQKMDKDNSGSMDREECKAFFKEQYGRDVKEEGLDKVFRADKDQDGKITFEEYLAAAAKVKAMRESKA